MKVLFCLLSFIGLSTIAQATVTSPTKTPSECQNELREFTLNCDSILYEQLMKKHHGVSQCKDVRFNNINEHGNQQSVNETIFLLGNNGLVVVNQKSSDSCKLHYMNLTDTIKEAKVISGRVIMRSEKGRIYAISRMGSVKEVFNDYGKSYFGVKDIVIRGDDVEITHNSHEILTAKEIFDRLNRMNGSEIVGM